MALRTLCQTSGAIFHTEISSRHVAISVDLPADFDLDEDQAVLLEANLHNAVELALAPLFVRREILATLQGFQDGSVGD